MNETEDLNETSELMDCIRELSSVQSRLKHLIDVFDQYHIEKRCAEETLELTTHVRSFIQNNFQKLRIGLDV
jgi:hypothetical protein